MVLPSWNLTNQIQAAFQEPWLLVVTGSRAAHQHLPEVSCGDLTPLCHRSLLCAVGILPSRQLRGSSLSSSEVGDAVPGWSAHVWYLLPWTILRGLAWSLPFWISWGLWRGRAGHWWKSCAQGETSGPVNYSSSQVCSSPHLTPQGLGLVCGHRSPCHSQDWAAQALPSPLNAQRTPLSVWVVWSCSSTDATGNENKLMENKLMESNHFVWNKKETLNLCSKKEVIDGSHLDVSAVGYTIKFEILILIISCNKMFIVHFNVL